MLGIAQVSVLEWYSNKLRYLFSIMPEPLLAPPKGLHIILIILYVIIIIQQKGLLGKNYEIVTR